MLTVDKKRCTGCTACKNICLRDAITFVEDENGFKYPNINLNKCNDCGLCEKVCFCNRDKVKMEQQREIEEYYLCQHKVLEKLKNSQSGGVAFALGEAIIDDGGYVFGCKYNEKCVAIHAKATNIIELKAFCGSKYVQSDLNEVFASVRNQLLKGEKVLFTGTSCQVSGLYNFLQVKKAPMNNLYTMDIICHGVVSPKILREYIQVMEKKFGSEIKSINLRDRRYAPKIVTVLKDKNNREYIDNNYLDIFYSNVALRECCGNCEFATRQKPADITVGDTIGVSEKYKEILDETNPSSVAIVHTNKGRKLLMNSQLEIRKIKKEEFSQPNINRPTLISPQKEKFWRMYKKSGMEYVLKYYTGYGGIKTKIRRKILIYLRRW